MVSVLASFVTTGKDGEKTLDLQISGMKCASCVQRIQQAIMQDGTQTHIDLASGHASLRWLGESERSDYIAERIRALGYQVQPFAPDSYPESGADLGRSMAGAGLASAAVMGLGMLHEPPVWVMAAVTVLALGYAGRPFFASAWQALKGRHANMDVPISLALILTTVMSLFEIAHQGTYAYFDSVVMLLFILLIGRYLDAKTRGRARAAAAELLVLFAGKARVREGEVVREMPIRELLPEMVLSVAAGEKIAADGVVTQGVSDVDPSLITGETLSQPVEVGSVVFGGMVNLTASLHVRVTAAMADSLVSEVIRLMERAQQAHARFVRLADRVAALYTPAVFALALLTFFGWWLGFDMPWQRALLITSTVLIITCPCAMGLAVPAVQVIASSRLFRKGMLLKTGDALEKLAKTDVIVFDKTGTLTLGRPKLVNRADVTTENLKLAASLAAHSRHPLARAVSVAYGVGLLYAIQVTEHAGLGLEAVWEGQKVRLGRRDWCGDKTASVDESPELWLDVTGRAPLRFAFADEIKSDARRVVGALQKQGYQLYLYSGDRESVVRSVAQSLGLDHAHGHMSPTDKHASIQALRGHGYHVLMVGDGLNDAAALAAADVSLSPSSALDITQNAADIVFQGQKLAPVLEALKVAHRAEKIVWQNILLSLLYNLIAVPMAMAGLASPLVAAAAMSLSSLSVVLNAQRMRG